jgi:hypothetical protein
MSIQVVEFWLQMATRYAKTLAFWA